MKFGYATLLGEIIDAEKCDYDDCKTFQIVCPNCREPIFKTHREASETHFFSHYQKNKLDFETCELRVSNLSAEKVLEFNYNARKQSLNAFLGQFRKQLRALRWYPKNPKSIQKLIKRNLLFKAFVDGFVSSLGSPHQKNSLIALFKSNIFDESNCDIVTKQTEQRQLAVQESIAFDVFKMLLTQKERSNLIELSALSVDMLINRCVNKHADNISEALNGMLGEQSQIEAHLALCGTTDSRYDFEEYFGQLSNLSHDGVAGGIYFNAEIFHIMSMILLNFPYQSMRNHKAGDEWDSTLFFDTLSIEK